ncbi:MAG TPA: pyruvate kinase [Pyrinomonadaceae bacterium]|nr:pyruvate kinase [Pyrinomonadaceae bacterium]
METYRFENGRVIRRVQVLGTDGRLHYVDDQPLKTKIVASLGKPHKYKGRLGRESAWAGGDYESMYEEIITTFYNNGVDVIRLNLSHPPPVPLPKAFAMIKRAIQKVERQKVERRPGNRKRIAILADLPGPKIRFGPDSRFKQDDSQTAKPVVAMVFTVGKRFTVHFSEVVESEDSATVFLDKHPLAEGLDSAARDSHNDRIGISDDEDEGRVENVLGGGFLPPESRGGSLLAVMERVDSGLKGREPVLVTVGDGEVVMEVIKEGFDPQDTKLPCRVISVRAEQDDKEATPSLRIGSAKGFTIKGVDFDIPSFTSTDAGLLGELLKADYEGHDKRGWEPVLAFVALSFAQTADDALRIKRFIEDRLRRRLPRGRARLRAPSVIAKIETRKGWDNRKYILDVADGIMVARGDLGLQVDIEEVPGFQKRLIKLCNKRGKPVITATQMLSSMTKSIEPTRAEATDVFNAILDGSDAVMMSEETAAGNYPLESIRKMIGIAVRAEWFFERRGMSSQMRRDVNLRRYQEFLEDEARRVKADLARFAAAQKLLSSRRNTIRQSGLSAERAGELKLLDWRMDIYGEKAGKADLQATTDRITQATCMMSEGEKIRAIVAATTSGRTVRMISRLRPSVLLIGAAHDPINTRKLAVSYGVLPICIGEVGKAKGTEAMFEHCRGEIEKDEHLHRNLGDSADVIFTAGTRLGHPGSTNVIQMRRIREDIRP